MDARDPTVEQLATQFDTDLDADGTHGLSVVRHALQPRDHRLGQRATGQFRELVNLPDVGDRHQAGDDGNWAAA